MRTRSGGFTLIELLVVIAIIGILSAVILTAFSASRVKGRTAAAMQSMKAIQSIMNLCINSGASTFCFPGQTTLGCGATATGDTNDGGGALICTNNTARYAALPAGWVYCDSLNTGGTCGNDASSMNNPLYEQYLLRAENQSDQTLITCNATACTPGTEATWN